ncbi:uncharacterized protein GGS25DRAFT_522339 [Hypoxylon fragiforme]|uniref:uncharacterized protein n=1 Tax=Hypoxylon fragiforme TaxID=63214 RepID=UPI0020C6F9FB|nr:uncharacterized protein GGS25DRAFT_522339 [Hypoxylon fragiforme]KAI2606818.1 hypothetical protein GGS25DRAFT_522339 [Hypoxylon fragiforme]
MDLQLSPVEKQSRLLTIPLEVLLNISSHLTTAEYGNLRRTCRHIEASFYKSFAKEFFTKRQFMITPFSLEALVDISKSRFASSVKYLIISLERPPAATHINSLSPPPFTDLDGALSFNKMRQEKSLHQSLVSSGEDSMLLTEALQGLTNLETVGLRDFASSGRWREGLDHNWQTYGAPTFLAETGGYMLEVPRFDHHIDITVQDGPIKYISHTFLTILRALGKTQNTHNPPRLECILRHCHLPDQAFHIPRYLESAIFPLLNGLKTLFLDLGSASFSPIVINDEGSFKRYLALSVVMFLSKTPALEHLRLNFRSSLEHETTDLLQWLAQDPTESQTTASAAQDMAHVNDLRVNLLPRLPQSPEFPHLVQLDIGMITIRPSLLLSIFKKFKSTLRQISLHRIVLQCAQIHNTESKVNHWAKLLKHIAKLQLDLSAVKLSYLKQKHGHSMFPALFKDLSKDTNARSVLVVEWAGQDWKRFSTEVIESVHINWQNGLNNQDGELGSSDSEGK